MFGESEKERGKRKEKVENHTTELQEKRSPRVSLSWEGGSLEVTYEGLFLRDLVIWRSKERKGCGLD